MDLMPATRRARLRVSYLVDEPMASEEGFLEWRRLGSFLLLTAAGPVPQDALERLIKDVQRHLVKGVLAVAAGHVQMTSVQRRLVSNAFRGIPIAAIVEDRLTRGVVTAIAWLGTAIKAFQPSDVESAMDYVGVAMRDKDSTREALAQLPKPTSARRSGAGLAD